MLRSLYSRLAITLFLLLCLVGLVLVQIIGRASLLYQQEVAQKLNRELAEHIVADHSLSAGQLLNQSALDRMFESMMVINPSIEVYLLDIYGRILAYNAPSGAVKRQRVSLSPIREFLADNTRFPLAGDDPRSLSGRKVFSAAAVPGQGYLYIVLGSERYQHIAAMIGDSYILYSAMAVVLVSLIVALAGGLSVFALLTRRLRRLGSVMRAYAADSTDSPVRYPADSPDEIDCLGRQFNVMADRISRQLADLKRADNTRREMVANISHDLRTPLTSLRGYLETLEIKREELHDQQRQDYLRVALRQARRLGRMVDELFELARLDAFEAIPFAEPFSLGELAQDVSQSFRLRAKQEKVRLEVRVHPDTPLVHGDIGMMQRVLENLLENGLRHTPAQGRLSVWVEPRADGVQVSVSNTGSAIRADEIERVFERFYQQDKSRHGNHGAGLGLAIVRRILELHGSAIQVNSNLEQGTAFRFFMVADVA